MCCWGWEWCQLWDREGGEGGKQHGRKAFFPSGDAQMGQLEGLLQTIFTPDGHEEQGASRGWGRPCTGAVWDNAIPRVSWWF